METETEKNEIKEEYQKAKAEGRQPLCPYCNAPLEVGQDQTVFFNWRWDNESKTYGKEESDWEPDKPFCMNCEMKDWDFIDNDVINF